MHPVNVLLGVPRGTISCRLILLLAVSASSAPAADAPDGYLRLHCRRQADGHWPFGEPPPAAKPEGLNIFRLGELPIEVRGDGRVVIHCLPLVAGGTSRRRYEVSRAARELLPRMCAGGLREVLELLPQTELRQPWNDLYAADDLVPPDTGGPVVRLAGWRLVSRSRGDFRNVSPAPPAYISYPFRARLVARSEDEMWSVFASHYRLEHWDRKQMDAAHVLQVQRQWLASLGIDFAKQMVIGVCYGSEDVLPHAEVGIDAVRAVEGGLRVDCYRSAVRGGDGPGRPRSPYYDLVVCDRVAGPVVFFEDGRRAGRAHAEDLESIRQYFRRGGLADLVPDFAPLSSGAVPLAYPQRQHFRVERKLPDRYETFVLGVDELGRVKAIEEPADLAEGLIDGWGPEDRQRLIATAVITLQGALAGGFSADLHRSVVCREGSDGLIACVDRDEEPRFEVRFDEGGRFARIVDLAAERRPATVEEVSAPAPGLAPAPPRRAPVPAVSLETDFAALVAQLESSDYLVRTQAAARLGASRDPRAVEPLIAFLRQEKYGEGAGVAALRELGTTAAESLVGELADGLERADAVFLGKVAEILGETRESLALEPLVRALGHRDIGVRIQAAIALGKLSDSRAITPLIASLQSDQHYMVREHAAEALGRLKARDAMPALFEALKDSGVRDFAAKALKEIDAARTLTFLSEALRADAARSSAWALPALQQLGDEAVEPLLACLEHADVEVRRRALGAIGNALARGSGKKATIVDSVLRFFETGRGDFLNPDEQVVALETTEDPRAVRRMIRLLARTNGIPPHQLLSALSRGRIGGMVEEPLLAALEDADGNIRIGAAACLGVLKSQRAVAPLIVRLRDRDPRLRFNAARALGDVGDRRAVASLRGLAQDRRESEEVRLQAVLALKKLKGPEAEAALRAIQDDPTNSRELALFAAPAKEALKQDQELRAQLLRGLASRDPLERVQAAAALAALDEPRATDVLIESLRDADASVREQAVWGLQSVKDRRIVAPLVALLGTEEKAAVSEVARRAIGMQLSSLEPAPFIAIVENGRSSQENRIFAIEVLGSLGEREAIEPLVALLKADGEGEKVKKSCLLALGQIQDLRLQGVILYLLDRKEAALDRFIALGLKQLTGQEFGGDSRRMREWVLENRERLDR